MCELLKDNMEADRKRALRESKSGLDSVFKSPTLREVPDLLSWLQCFSLFAGVVISRYPDKAKDSFAYQALMIYEARRNGGKGWALYDSFFRQQIISLSDTDFGKMNQSLYASTFLALRGRGQFCSGCMGADHTFEDCALHPNKSMPMLLQYQSKETAYKKEDPRRKKPRRGACFSWNDGECTAKNCPYDHVCSRCFGEHRKRVCHNQAGDRTPWKVQSSQ